MDNNEVEVYRRGVIWKIKILEQIHGLANDGNKTAMELLMLQKTDINKFLEVLSDLTKDDDYVCVGKGEKNAY
jgi:hypothetical protein